jgi:hypothetical protein
MSLRVDAMPDDRSVQAVLYGPIVLAGAFGSEGIPGGLIRCSRLLTSARLLRLRYGPHSVD